MDPEREEKGNQGDERRSRPIFFLFLWAPFGEQKLVCGKDAPTAGEGRIGPGAGARIANPYWRDPVGDREISREGKKKRFS